MAWRIKHQAASGAQCANMPPQRRLAWHHHLRIAALEQISADNAVRIIVSAVNNLTRRVSLRCGCANASRARRRNIAQHSISRNRGGYFAAISTRDARKRRAARNSYWRVAKHAARKLAWQIAWRWRSWRQTHQRRVSLVLSFSTIISRLIAPLTA